MDKGASVPARALALRAGPLRVPSLRASIAIAAALVWSFNIIVWWVV